MNKYEVTYEAVSPAFKNLEIEVPREKAAEIRQILAASLKNREPIVHGREWDYKAVAVRDIMMVEADYYSVSNNGTAHFYQEPLKAPTASVLNVIHVRKMPDDWDCSEFAKYVLDNYGTGWVKDKGFPPDTFSAGGGGGGGEYGSESPKVKPGKTLSNAVGDDAIPLSVMNEMAKRKGVVPKDAMKEVVAEMDGTADKIKARMEAGEHTVSADVAKKQLTNIQARSEFNELLETLKLYPKWWRMVSRSSSAAGHEFIELRPAYTPRQEPPDTHSER